jgi:hypothetical protein
MPISSNEYIEITSVSGGASAVSARKLQLRLVTTNELVPTGEVLSFVDADTVKDYFGATSDEYLQVVPYFGKVDKSGNSPDSVQFTRWADADTSAQVFGTTIATLTDLQAVTAGAFNVVYGGSTYNLTGLDLSGEADLAGVAALLQADIRALDASLVAATVVYDAIRGGFNLDTQDTADGSISFVEVTAGLLDDLGWNALAIYSDGIAEQTLTEMMADATSTNNNYGSFATIEQLTLDQTVELATWNSTQNVMFQYYPRATLANAVAWSAALIDLAGCGLIGFDDTKTTEYPWIHPAAELAAINWDNAGAVKNFMYTQSSYDSALITSTAGKTTNDALRLNYFGSTQEAGTIIKFFQNGVLMGGLASPLQMGVYAGEQWLKAEAKAQFLSMFLALNIVGADDTGRAQATKYIQDFMQQGIDNGVISTGKTLNTTQKAYITQITGDNNAWQTVQREGAYYTTSISEETVGSVTEYTLEYTFIYAKRDGVNKIEGRHILI